MAERRSRIVLTAWIKAAKARAKLAQDDLDQAQRFAEITQEDLAELEAELAALPAEIPADDTDELAAARTDPRQLSLLP